MGLVVIMVTDLAHLPESAGASFRGLTAHLVIRRAWGNGARRHPAIQAADQAAVGAQIMRSRRRSSV